jgi:predicted  nucleic acid-binding Zn-ribbon protein
MDFQHLASVEARELADRLLQEHAAASLRHVRILREALDLAAQEIAAPGDPGPLIQALVERLTTAAAADVESARQAAAAPIQALEAELERERERAAQLASALAGAEAETSRLATEADTVRALVAAVEQQAAREAEEAAASLADAERHRAALAEDVQAERGRADAAEHRATETAERLEAGRAEIERLTSALHDAERQAAAWSADLEGARARADALDQDLAVTIDAHGEVERALRGVQAELRQAAQGRAALEADLAASRALLDAAQSEGTELRGQIERQVVTIAAIEARLADALDASADRDALTTELESRRVRIEALEDAARERDAYVHALETKLRDSSRAEAQLLEDLAARELALEHEQTAARGVREQLDLVIAAHESAANHIHSLEADLAAVREAAHERDGLAADLRDSAGRAEALRAELDAAMTAATAERDMLHGELSARAARIDALEAELAEVTRSAHEDRGGLAERLEIAVARADTLEQAHAAEVTARTHIQAQLDVVLREAEARTGGRDGDPAAEALQRDVDHLAALFDGSVRALAEMAQVTSSADLLTVLAKRLSLQFSRIALFRVKGDRLAGEQQIGFDALDITTLALPSSGESLVARALRSGTLARATGPEAGDSGLPPGGPSTLALALPILLHGVAIAVVYADDAGMPGAEAGHETSVQFAELLVGHAVALLVRYTHELRTLAELREYAATLIAEARAMYQADLESGRAGENLRGRLRESLDCASQLYAYRAAMEGTVAAGLLDEQIAEASAGDTPFAHDLRGLVDTCESLILNH